MAAAGIVGYVNKCAIPVSRKLCTGAGEEHPLFFRIPFYVNRYSPKSLIALLDYLAIFGLRYCLWNHRD